MPGAYAHITIVNHAAKDVRNADFSIEAKRALGSHLRYAELGAVSPDYPYLGVAQGKWADRMHYTNNAALLRAGVREVRTMQGNEREKAMSWLFGFAGHMTADMTIHPIVERIVGPYAQNKAAHRECEGHQDAYIFERMDLGEASVTEHLKSGIASCNGPDLLTLDATIVAVWKAMLTAAYPEEMKTETPLPHVWHAGFTKALAAIGSVNRLFPFSRHIGVRSTFVYPEKIKVELDAYISNVPTPEGPMPYDRVFERALSNILSVWKGLDAAIQHGDTVFLDSLKNWNLDTGREVESGKLVFWSEPHAA